MLPITLPPAEIETLTKLAAEGREFSIDLEAQTVIVGDVIIQFEIEPFRKECLLNGLDDIALTLKQLPLIDAFEKMRSREYPWLDGVGFGQLKGETAKKTDW